MYIETSRGSVNRRKDGDVARLDSPVLPATGAYCLSFWYHMFGPDVNRLQVRVLEKIVSSVRWARRGTQGMICNSKLYFS